jgi:hypothetical protein
VDPRRTGLHTLLAHPLLGLFHLLDFSNMRTTLLKTHLYLLKRLDIEQIKIFFHHQSVFKYIFDVKDLRIYV